MAGKSAKVAPRRAPPQFESLEVIRLLGEGSTGEVFETRHVRTGARYVVKRLWPESRTPLELARFEREAEVMLQLRHPNLMPVVRFEARCQPPYYVMPFHEGLSVAQLVKACPPLAGRVGVVASIAHDVCLGLAEAHRLGVVHRDVKPGNLLVDPAGNTLVLDFGLAKLLASGAETLTAAGTIVGTPRYMSPEQCRGELVTDRTDVYSLGVVVVELLLGRNPFASTSLARTLQLHLEAMPRRLDALLPGRVGVELGELVHRMIAKEPRQRPRAASCVELFAELARPEDLVALTHAAGKTLLAG